jgi:hypothetical protein
MAGRRRSRWSLAAVTRRLAAGMLAGAVGLGVPTAGVGAATPSAPVDCTPTPVPFERIVDDAKQVFLVTVATRRFAGGVPETYTFVVREALRGTLPEDVSLPATITVEAPVVTTCGGLLDARVNAHLVIALAVPAFDGGPAIAVPWQLRPDGSLVGGFDDGPDRWLDLEALRDALAGRPFATPQPTVAPTVVGEAEGAPLAAFGILVGLVGGVLAGIAVIMAGRRAARPRGPRPPAPPTAPPTTPGSRSG